MIQKYYNSKCSRNVMRLFEVIQKEMRLMLKYIYIYIYILHNAEIKIINIWDLEELRIFILKQD